MQLVCLNLWGGKAFDPLMKFLKEISATTDVFCFQEVFDTTSQFKTYEGLRMNLYAELAHCLSDFERYFSIAEQGYAYTQQVHFSCDCGLALLVKKSHRVLSHGSFSLGVSRPKELVWKEDGWHEVAQCATIVCGNTQYILCNVHGICDWPKTDTPERLEQSRKIIDVMNQYDSKKIVCGDFNLDPNSESVKMFEKVGMRNLVREYTAQNTRSTLFEKKHNEVSDYVFVSPDVKVEKFVLPLVAVSDHLPLVLNFE